MFNVGTGEMLLLLVLALIVLGPDKLPSAARQAGRWLAEIRRVSDGFQSEFRRAVDSAMDDTPGLSDFKLPDLPNLSDLAPSMSSFRPVDTAAPITPERSALPVPGDAPLVSLDKPAGPEDTASGHLSVDGPADSFS